MNTKILFGLMAASCVLAGCRGQTSRERPIVGIRNMFDQGKYDIQEQSEFFSDGRTMRPLPEGVVANDEEIDPEIAQGILEDGSGYVLHLPQQTIDRAGSFATLIKRGQDRYNVYCSMCHGETGTGEGVVKQRAQLAGAAAFVPANLHDERMRHMPDGQLFATISNGKGNMAPYAYAVPVQDRWAIVAYVRALQLAAPKFELPTAAPVEEAPAPAPKEIPTAPSGEAPTEPAPAVSGEAAPTEAAPATSGDAAPTEAAPTASGSEAAPAASAPSGAEGGEN